MTASTDLNIRIALAKGWTRHEETFFLAPDFGSVPELRTHWLAPIIEGERYAEPAMLPDFVGTLKGVSGMLWELGEEWTLHPDPPNDWLLWRNEFVYGIAQTFSFPRGKLGNCVANAWLYVFEVEAANEIL